MTLPNTGGEHGAVRFGGDGRRLSSIVGVILSVALSCPALAEGAGQHRAAAELAERVGDFAAAASEYAAAFAEEHQPELLYRAGVARRRLRRYVEARDAFRQYLKLDPAGPLKDEAERQLAQLDVIVEELRRHEAGEPPQRRAGRKTQPRRSANPPAPAAPFEPLVTSVPRPPAAAAAGPLSADAGALRPADSGTPRSADASAPRAAAPRPLQLEAAPAPRTVHPIEPRLGPAFTAVEADAPFPARTAAPWVAAGAAAFAISGGLLWWDGARTSRDLDARFASGDLTAADAARYGRARNESIAGRVLVGAALCAGAAAVWLWR